MDCWPFLQYHRYSRSTWVRYLHSVQPSDETLRIILALSYARQGNLNTRLDMDTNTEMTRWKALNCKFAWYQGRGKLKNLISRCTILPGDDSTVSKDLLLLPFEWLFFSPYTCSAQDQQFFFSMLDVDKRSHTNQVQGLRKYSYKCKKEGDLWLYREFRPVKWGVKRHLLQGRWARGKIVYNLFLLISPEALPLKLLHDVTKFSVFVEQNSNFPFRTKITLRTCEILPRLVQPRRNGPNMLRCIMATFN